MKDTFVVWFAINHWHVDDINVLHIVTAESVIPAVSRIGMEWSVPVVMYMFRDRSSAGM